MVDRNQGMPYRLLRKKLSFMDSESKNKSYNYKEILRKANKDYIALIFYETKKNDYNDKLAYY